MLCALLLNCFVGNKEATPGNCLSLQDAPSLCCAGMVACCESLRVSILTEDVSSADLVRMLNLFTKTSLP